MPSPDLTERLWSFVAARLAVSEFEQWLYATPELQALLGNELYLETISTDFRDPAAIQSLREKLCARLDPTGVHRCHCLFWTDKQVVPLSSDTTHLSEDYDVIRKRNPWLELVRCNRCGQHWYMAVDIVDDDYYFRRLSGEDLANITKRNEWPADFDNFENVWPREDPSTWHKPARYPWR